MDCRGWPDRGCGGNRQPVLARVGARCLRFAFRDADPVGALNALRRGLVIAQDSGNRNIESVLANVLARLEAEHGDTLAAFDHLTLAIRNYHECGRHHD